MIRGALRQSPQQGPPARFGITGRLVCLLVFIAICKVWPREILIGFAVLVLFVLPAALVLGRARASRPRRGELDSILRRWDREGRR